MADRSRLSPEQVASRAFPISFRGFDQSEVRSFLAAVAEELRAAVQAGERAAAGVIAAAEERAADLLAEAQDEARRIRATVEGERERAFADGAAHADELVAEAERVRSAAETVGNAEAERLVAEARAVRERILGDLARRRATLREQVEQLHAARDRLLGALAGLRTQVEDATEQLRIALPEAKVAADAAARRVAAEPLPSTLELEREIEAFRAAGLELTPSATPVRDEAPGDVEEDAPVVAESPAASQNGTHGPTIGEAPPLDEASPPERRSTAVRVFRTRRDPTPALGVAEPELHAVEPAAPFEEVRLVAASGAGDETAAVAGDVDVETADATAVETAVEAAPDEPSEHAEASVPDATSEATTEATDAPAATPELAGEVAVDDAAHAPPPAEAIDELFARLKAGRQERTAAAEVVLAPAGAAPIDAAPTGAAVAVAEERSGTEAADAADLARRDAAIVPFRDALAKRLKRQLADEQNEVLDGLRRGESRIFDLADADDHAAAWSLAAAHDLAAAANAGARFDGGDAAGPISGTEVAVVAEHLADQFARPLRTKVLEAIDAADGDEPAASAAVRSIYRDRRGRRLDEAVEHAVLGAFSTGIQTAAPFGAAFRWVVDDGPNACPDCDDNALAGPVTAGSAYPTGHLRPPAHPGCRCLLVRARAR